MNSRMIKLAQVAGMYVDLNGNPWPKWMTAEECELAYAKFAELIVKECMEWCDAHATINGTAQQIRDSIKKDFGVEE